MKPLSEQDHYQILEISRDASAEEIERSFRMAQATWADDSLAGYSVFGEGEAQAIHRPTAAGDDLGAKGRARTLIPAVDHPVPVAVGRSRGHGARLRGAQEDLAPEALEGGQVLDARGRARRSAGCRGRQGAQQGGAPGIGSDLHRVEANLAVVALGELDGGVKDALILEVASDRVRRHTIAEEDDRRPPSLANEVVGDLGEHPVERGAFP